MPLLAWLIVGDHEDQDRVRTLFLEKNWGSAQATGPAAATTAATTAFSLRKQPLGFIEKNMAYTAMALLIASVSPCSAVHGCVIYQVTSMLGFAQSKTEN
jgi:hypothetical protein